jgi:hypothetical protein
MKGIVFDNEEESFSLNEQVNSFDCLQIEQFLRMEIEQFLNNYISKSSK